MLAEHFQTIPTKVLESPAIMYGESMITFADLATRIGVLNERWRSLAGLRVGIALRDPVDHVAVAAALEGLGCHAFLAGGRNSAEIRALADQLHWDAVVWNLMDEPEEMNAPPAGNSVRLSPKGVVTVLTSGTRPPIIPGRRWPVPSGGTGATRRRGGCAPIRSRCMPEHKSCCRPC
jgi:hypothetical protein